MSDERSRADELLERARRLQGRTGDSDSSSPRRPARRADDESSAGRGSDDGGGGDDEDYNWFGRWIRQVGRGAKRVWRILTRIPRYLGPLGPVIRFIARQIRRFVLFVSCRKDETGVRTVVEFSIKRLAKSVLVGFLCYALVIVVYIYGTRREGVFLINNFHLVDSDSDTYQLGGCMQLSPEQLACDDSDAEIVLIRPAWIPGMGLNPLDYEEEVGQIPIQGQCEIGMYGWYLRGPSLTRGLLKPVAFSVSHCRATLGH